MNLKNSILYNRENKIFQDIFSMLFIILIVGGYAFMLHNRMMPLSEGWYTYYAQCINAGMLPYKDFEYLFPPIYIFFISTFTKIFGYEIIYLRLLGIIFIVLINIGLYFSLRIVFKQWISCISSITAVLYLQTESAQVFYDYVRLMDISAVFSMLLLLLSVKNISNNQQYNRNLTLCGFFISTFIMIKQNMGLIFWAYSLVVMFFVLNYLNIKKKEQILILKKFILSVIIPIFSLIILLFLTGTLLDFLNCIGYSALKAKGGILVILFNWIFNNSETFLVNIKKSLFAILSLGILVALSFNIKIKYNFNDMKTVNGLLISWKTRFQYLNEDKFNDFLYWLFPILTFIGMLIFMFNENIAMKFEWSKSLSPYLLFLICMIIFLTLFFLLILDIKNKTYNYKKIVLPFVLLGSYIAISYGCGTSAGLAEGQAPIGLAFCLSVFLYFTNFNYGKYIRLFIVLICVFFSLQCIDKKMIHTYYWWGIIEDTYWQSTEELEISILRGIKVSKKTKEVYENIYKFIESNSQKEDKLLCFPNIPIFYNICNRNDPGTYSKIQWFDFSSDTVLSKDIDFIKENPPKIILMYELSEEAYSMHEKLFRKGEKSGTRKMRDELFDIISVEYVWCNEFSYNNNKLNLWMRKK